MRTLQTALALQDTLILDRRNALNAIIFVQLVQVQLITVFLVTPPRKTEFLIIQLINVLVNHRDFLIIQLQYAHLVIKLV